ncbi:MAG: hypothetical protein JW892_05060 [Anaerolineae bacterium]|nr:hypothetical protein [Anaerolineae bacterium]
MLNLQMIEVGIGLALIYFLLSIIVSTINEAIARIWEMRAATLKVAIKQMLGGEYEEQVELATKFYQHSLIKSLFHEGTFDNAYNKRKKPRVEARVKARRASRSFTQPVRAAGFEFTALDSRGGPSYIPSTTFAKTIVSVLKEQASPEAQKKSAPLDEKPLGDLFTNWLKQRLTADNPPAELEDIRKAVEQLPNENPARQALLTLLDDAQGSLDRFEANLEAWFNTTMERVSGWYKRKLQLITLVIAAVVTLALNVDTILIANTLYRDPTLRQAVVTAAEKRVAATQESTVQATEMLSTTVGSLTVLTTTTTISPTSAISPTQTAPLTQIDGYITELYALQLPVGWPDPQNRDAPDLGLVPHTFVGWLSRIGGWLLTIFALALGAPFWFDMLNKLVNLRGAGEPEEKKTTKTTAELRGRSR